MFCNEVKKLNSDSITITYAGKICKLKGLKSLINSLDKLQYYKEFININIVGDGSSKKEYEEILELAQNNYFNIIF